MEPKTGKRIVSKGEYVKAQEKCAFELQAWRQKARTLFPYSTPLLSLLADEETNVYGLLRAFLPLCTKAHESECEWELQRFFDYVDWCWRAEDRDISNAAGVAFYEHIRDFLPYECIRQFVKSDVLEQLHALFVETFTNQLEVE